MTLTQAEIERIDLKQQLRLSVVLSSLENIMQLDTDPKLRRAVCKRYLDLTDPQQEPDL